MFAVILIAVGFAALLAILLWGRRSTRRRAARARSMAVHPSAAGPGHLRWAERHEVAEDVADQLAADGFVCTRPVSAPLVQAAGLDGEYLVKVGRTAVVASYRTNGGFETLGEFRSGFEAVLAIVGHAELAAPS